MTARYRLLGWWKEQDFHNAKGVHSFDSIRDGFNEELCSLDEILDYLSSGTPIYSSMLKDEKDVVSGVILGPVSVYTDGEWIWPSSLEHHLINYSVALPKKFIDKVISGELPDEPTEKEIDAIVEYIETFCY